MKPKISAKRTPTLDEDDLRQLKDLSFSSVMADLAHSEERPVEDLKRSRSALDLTATHTDRTINELLSGAISSSDSGSGVERRRAPSARTEEPVAVEETGDLIDPTMLFPELQLKE